MHRWALWPSRGPRSATRSHRRAGSKASLWAATRPSEPPPAMALRIAKCPLQGPPRPALPARITQLARSTNASPPNRLERVKIHSDPIVQRKRGLSGIDDHLLRIEFGAEILAQGAQDIGREPSRPTTEVVDLEPRGRPTRPRHPLGPIEVARHADRPDADRETVGAPAAECIGYPRSSCRG